MVTGVWRTIVVSGLFVLAGGPRVAAQAPPSSEPPDPDEVEVVVPDDATPVTLPLIPVPTGCEAPQMPHVVFLGTVVDRDFRTIRFRIDTVRGGQPAPFDTDGLIDVRYGLDAQYLADGEAYLVSAVLDDDIGLLASRVADPVENFGGDEVIGVSETDVNCPEFEDPMRTLHPDGTSIDGGVLDPLSGAKVQIATAVLLPVGVGFGLIFLLAMFRLSLVGLYHSVIGRQRRPTP